MTKTDYNKSHLNTLVRVSAPARLHLGFLDLNGSIGRQFGSIGLAIDSHFTIIEASLSNSPVIQPPVHHSKVTRALELFFSVLGQHIPKSDRSIHIKVIKLIPEHSGFGSGTQFALAIGTALCRLYHIEATTPEIATHMGRGVRSGIGIATFDIGGFIVDGGSNSNQSTPPPVLAHHPFPKSWRIVLIMDSSNTGVHGKEELTAFKELPTFPLSDAQTICHLTLMKLLPALIAENITHFGEVVTQIQMLIGDHFAPAQGGRYTSQSISKLLEESHRLDNKGISQSSWGPTGCVFVQDEQRARQLVHTLTDFSQNKNFSNISFAIAGTASTGAKIEIIKQ
ncbi:beta-hydroxylase [Pseudomonadota bacterium]|nr:beta-hydroxylase [Pseudomonadota bacterium]